MSGSPNHVEMELMDEEISTMICNLNITSSSSNNISSATNKTWIRDKLAELRRLAKDKNIKISMNNAQFKKLIFEVSACSDDSEETKEKRRKTLDQLNALEAKRKSRYAEKIQRQRKKRDELRQAKRSAAGEESATNNNPFHKKELPAAESTSKKSNEDIGI